MLYWLIKQLLNKFGIERDHCVNKLCPWVLSNNYIWRAFLFDGKGGKMKSPKYETVKYSFESSYAISGNGHTSIVCWYMYNQKPMFEFQRRGNHVLQYSIFTENNVLSI